MKQQVHYYRCPRDALFLALIRVGNKCALAVYICSKSVVFTSSNNLVLINSFAVPVSFWVFPVRAYSKD